MRKAALDTIYKLATKDNKVIFIGSDLGKNILNDFKKNFPDRFFMEGISEQAIVGMASGLALEGYIPFVNTIGTFFVRRALEQIIIDASLQQLPVRFIGNGGGGVYAPLGPTHISFEDISILRTIPNLAVIAPCDAIEMKRLIIDSKNFKFPIYFRVAKGGDPIITDTYLKKDVKIGKALKITEHRENMIFSTGVITQTALKLAKSKKNLGVTHFHTIKPLDKSYISKNIKKIKKLFIIEENLVSGGFGSSILEFLSLNHSEHLHKIQLLGIKDEFPKKYGNQQTLLEDWQLSYNMLKKRIKVD